MEGYLGTHKEGAGGPSKNGKKGKKRDRKEKENARDLKNPATSG